MTVFFPYIWCSTRKTRQMSVPASTSTMAWVGTKASKDKRIASVKRPFELVMDARAGVAPDRVYELASQLAMSVEDLSRILGLSIKSLRNYRHQGQTLKPATGEQLLKLSELLRWGEKVFGTKENFRQWLEIPSRGLDGQLPLTLLETGGGIDLVQEELERIAYGDFS